mgnify:CR=1 FL=1
MAGPERVSSEGLHAVDLDEVRGRYLLRLGAMSAGIAATAGVISYIKGNSFGGNILLLVALALGGVSWSAARGGSRWLLGQVFAACIWVGVVALAGFSGGGLIAPVVVVIPVVPAIAGLVSGPKSVVAWTVLGVLPGIGFYVFQDAIPAPRLADDVLLTMRLMAATGAVLLVGITVWTYEQSRREQAALLQASHAEAQLAREAAEQAQEQAEMANRAKSAFLATMSHEIRTPLTAVVGVAEVLRGTGLEAEQARQLGLLEGAGRTLLGLVDDVLDLSRIESGQLELERIPVDVSELVQDVGAILQVRAQTRGVRLTCRHDGQAWVWGDPLRLRQILLNLVGNAVKFTEDGDVTVHSRVEARSDGAGLRGTLVVEDTGVGIPVSQQSAVFGAFVQADQGTARRFGGSGLGLNIVGHLVRLMDGTITLESKRGEGTVVTVRMPFEAAEPVRPTHPQQVDGGARPLRVLLAEDNPINQEVVRLMLQRFDCEVDIAENGGEAVSMVRKAREPYDLVLMDCQMPGVDGFEATRRLRSAGVDTPIIALTANATPSDRARCMAAGMDDFTSKPLTLADLRRVLAIAPADRG